MTTSPTTAGTPLTRDQSDIAQRLQGWLNAKLDDDNEKRDIALIQVLDREHAESLMDRATQGDAEVDKLLQDFPEDGPTREVLFRLLLNKQPTQLMVSLTSILARIRGLYGDLSLLAEYGWLLGRDGVDQTVQDKARIALRAGTEGLVAFAHAYGVPLPAEKADGELAADLAAAVAAVEAA